ncbi:phosphoribosylformylglycinamidine synthase subunit PurL [Desulfurispira natronophila]|uniref:Phosphoribosylformylglycinamidine synthase subunit PurL n=1 Tax=Desulfurispira natronophila TaxID=682562 RepID=A0A7W7Y3N7_9BACT|nr:phosphoribosylformylglycinamidine synthase subunit PurL [Desulfurispira natronophila]MBB5021472.1 phosphoribosylformylglycinamidine synthase [Desulfurispira natronophila]
MSTQEKAVSVEQALEFGLSREEYDKILEIMGRTPTLTELGIFSVMWSEHCSYKSSRIHLKGFPTEAPWVVQGPGENAGVIDIGDDECVAFKIESHNHPSFIEPLQGAATGVGGILRDVFTMGARPIAAMNSLRFGELDNPKNRYLFSGVVKGIGWYGNCFGVPTVGGEVYFDDQYSTNPLVNAFALGYVKKDKIFLGRADGVGNPVMYVGAKTGRDGIHGATMASADFDENSEEKRPTVQVGDPFTEKLLLEACLELMQTDHIIGIQDMGAAGLTSSSFEMADRAGMGIEMWLDNIPCREEGMTPYEMMLSESQERMLMVVRQGSEDAVKAIFAKWDLDAEVVGRVTDDGRMRIIWQGQTMADLEIAPLVEAAPLYDRPYQRGAYLDEVQSFDFNTIHAPSDFSDTLLCLLGSPTIASKEWVYQQYDHQVRTNTVILPGSDAALVRIKGGKKGVAMTTDCNSRFCYLNPYEGGKATVAEGARNIACSGAKPLAISDCLNFGNPQKPETMYQFVECVRGIKDACRELNIPVISGNVSLYNETAGRGAVYPTPTVSTVGLIEDIDLRLTQDFKQAGDHIFLLGTTREELGGSEYLKVIYGLITGDAPHVDLGEARVLVEVLQQLTKVQLLQSAHDCSEGGLAVALAESSLSSREHVGFSASLSPSMRTDALLFGESHSRAVVSVSPEKFTAFRETVGKQITCTYIGVVGGDSMNIRVGEVPVVSVSMDKAVYAWKYAIRDLMEQ